MLTTKKGAILIFQMSSGACLAEIEDAHYLSINDIAVSDDFCVTGGKDTKVRVWLTNDLFAHQQNAAKPYHEFGDAQMEITQVGLSKMSSMRVFSASLDKVFRVFDIPSRQLIK